jgi:hypothetical protein
VKLGHVPDRGRCECGKKNYRQSEAKRRAKTLRRETNQRLSEYRCPVSNAGFWHVGSHLKGSR